MGVYRDVERGVNGAWPLRVRPRDDELFSSWMVRCAHAHGYKVEKFGHKLFGREHGLWGADIDRSAGLSLLQTMAEITATTPDRAAQTTLHSYATSGRLPGDIQGAGHATWIVNLHRYHRLRRRPGLMYCPRCLDDRQPYFRRGWRLAFNTVCEAHAVDLLDACSACHRPIAFHRVDVGKVGRSPRSGAIRHCWHCDFDLRQAPTTASADGPLAVTKLLTRALNDGFIAWGDNPDLHAIPFFTGVRVLARLATRQAMGSNAHLETLPVEWRRQAMQALAPWLENWPEGFVRDPKVDSALTHSDVVKTQLALPFWLERDLQSKKRHQAPARTLQEVQAMVEHLAVQGKVKAKDMPRTLGANIGPAHRLALKSMVSPQSHEALMVHLDHAVSATANRAMRLAFLQDKTMFCLYRFTDLSLVELCKLSLGRMPAIEGLSIDDVWWTSPANRVDAILAAQYHVQRLRNAWPTASDRQEMFLSAYSGRPMRATALHQRFLRAVLSARLSAQIPSMAAYKLG